MPYIPNSVQFWKKKWELQVREIHGNRLTRTPRYTGGGIRCLEGVKIPCWPVTPAVSPKTQILEIKISVSRVGEQSNPQSKSASPDQVHRIIHSENQTYTDLWKHQKYDQVQRRRKHPLCKSHFIPYAKASSAYEDLSNRGQILTKSWCCRFIRNLI
jgi:hypothetical protein